MVKQIKSVAEKLIKVRMNLLNVQKINEKYVEIYSKCRKLFKVQKK